MNLRYEYRDTQRQLEKQRDTNTTRGKWRDRERIEEKTWRNNNSTRYTFFVVPLSNSLFFFDFLTVHALYECVDDSKDSSKLCTYLYKYIAKYF